MNRIKNILILIFIALVAVGSLVVIVISVNWDAGIEFKIDLLRSIFIVSTALIGFAGILLLKLAKDIDVFVDKLGISKRKIKNLRVFISWSIVLGCITVLSVLFYFITYEISLITVAWITLIIQLEMFVIPQVFSRVIIFR